MPFDIVQGTGETYIHTNKGSGIALVGTGVNVRSGASLSFLYNAATNGGAIAAYASGWIMLWNDTELDFHTHLTSLQIGPKVEVGAFPLNQLEGTKLSNPGNVCFVILNGGGVMRSGTVSCTLKEILLVKLVMTYSLLPSFRAFEVALKDLLIHQLMPERRCFVQHLHFTILAI